MESEVTMKQVILLIAVLVFMFSCTKIDYVGREYPPTEHVDIFFSLDDVELEYTIMGHITATADDFVSAEKMQKEMLQKAREKGADALVILGLEHYTTGGKSTYAETVEKKEDKETTTGVTTTSVEEKKEIKGTLLKYK